MSSRPIAPVIPSLPRPAVPVGSRTGQARRLPLATVAEAPTWLLAVSPVTLPIPGTATPAHLEDNLAAAALQLEQDEIHAITAAASRATQRAAQAT
jgi:aryl-alcohol dehydrogenase-like predicted oxidoreductase